MSKRKIKRRGKGYRYELVVKVLDESTFKELLRYRMPEEIKGKI